MNSKNLLLGGGLVVVIVGAGIGWWVGAGKKALTKIPGATRVHVEVTPTTLPELAGRYVDYFPQEYQENAGKRRVLFFKATWCPTCNAADIDFGTNLSQIPKDVVILKVDYDREAQLKQRYGVTYQHTFVQVDRAGNELAKWNGGATDALLANIK